MPAKGSAEGLHQLDLATWVAVANNLHDQLKLCRITRQQRFCRETNPYSHAQIVRRLSEQFSDFSYGRGDLGRFAAPIDIVVFDKPVRLPRWHAKTQKSQPHRIWRDVDAEGQRKRNLTVRPKHPSDQNFDHDYYFKLPFQGAGCPIKWTTFYFTPCPITSFPAFEPNSTNCEWPQPFRHSPVQPNGKFSGHGYFGNSFFPAHPQCRYRRRQSGLHRAAACAASTSKKRSRALPCLLICPSRCCRSACD